jgi:XTP/dITP diphosphohydrolase
MKVVLATTNPGKLKEFTSLAKEVDWLQLVMAPDGFNPKETGKTFFENAKIKATEAAKLTGSMAMADDSGIVIEALDGKPGILSARYCEGSDADRRKKVLAEMKSVPEQNRQAAFVCAMVVCKADGEVAFHTIRYWEGMIGTQEKGSNGFGYDPIFFPRKCKGSAAELEPAEKNRISHRGQAWQQVANYLKQNRAQLDSK